MVEIDEYQKLEVGVGVTVRGVGRALITKVLQADPYVKAQVSARRTSAAHGRLRALDAPWVCMRTRHRRLARRGGGRLVW